jgi:drug/metabolite transporter (DMT)-like permease
VNVTRHLLPARGARFAIGRDSTTIRGVMLVTGAALAFATLGTLSGIAYRAGMGSATFVALRAVLGAALLIGVLAARPAAHVSLRSLRGSEKLILAAAMGANATLNLALFAAYGQMAVALVLAVYFTYPMLVAGLSVLIGRERFTAARSVGLLMAGIGVAMVLAGQVGDARLTVVGVIWALSAAGCQALYLVLSRASFTQVPAEQAIAITLGGGGVLAIGVALAVDLPAGQLLSWTGNLGAWAAVVTAAVLGAAAAKVWLLRGVRLLGGTRTAVIMLIEPIAGVLLAAAVLGQGLTPLQALGGAAILGAALLVKRPAPGPAAPVTT